ncbi:MULTISPECIES: hypothetical protein [Planococcus]|uniref:Uncharacterized protein n=2 Tax=Planococcus TaxID=1372 RepID=A0ABM5WUA3_9BACL|nr:MULTISPECIES: hypothetical protein [Planococcus]ALS77921.1 hypothetical protein AUO94_04350 [Planococcus kocurii]AQU80176.1 hypothetical protein AJGP001_13195 [Planococcus faecalis]MDJ0332612.1 hypothetical protein [Planococcus sp. S3-L1]
MWALLTGGFVFVTAIIFSLGKASSKREDASHRHREELLARNKDTVAKETVVTILEPQPAEQQKSHRENKTRHPSEQL